MNEAKSRRAKIAVLMGGEGCEHAVSLMSAEYLLRVIDRGRYEPYPVFIDRRGAWFISTENGEPISPTYPVRMGDERGFLTEKGLLPVDAVFPMLHGDMGEDGRVQGALECAGIPYVGAEVSCGAVTADKIYTKMIAEHCKIPTVEWLCHIEGDCPEKTKARAEEKLGYPMFIKPSGLGSSIGAHPVYKEEEFFPALEDALSRCGRVLIERMLLGIREIEVGYFHDGTERLITPPAEISPDGFYGYEEKYSSCSAVRLSPRAELPTEAEQKILGYADTLARELGLRELGRIDFFLREGEIYFNEINTMPGFTSGSLYPRMLCGCGISPTELLTRLIESARRRGI